MHELVLASGLLLFLGVFAGLGAGLEMLLPRLLPPAPGPFARAVLGMAAAMALAFLSAATGTLGRPAAFVLLALAGLAIWRRRRELALPLRASLAASELAPALLVAATLLPAFLIAINPAVLWDAAVYHLTLPRLYLEAGGFVPLEMSVYAVWPHGPQLLYAFGLLFGGPPLAKLLHFGSGLLVLAGLHHALRRSGLPCWRFGAWVAIALFVVHPLVHFELQTAYVDLFQTLFFFAAFLFLGQAAAAAAETGEAERTGDRAAGHLLAAGIASGAVAVCKPTGLLFLPALLPLIFAYWLARRRQGAGGPAWRLLLTRFAPPILILWLPWVWRSFRLTGNPFYPFFWETFGGPDWNAELGAQLLAWQRGMGMGREPLDYLLLPWRALTQGGRDYAHFDGRLAVAALPFLLLALWRAARPGPPPLLRPALACSALYFVLWAMSSQQLRFLIPILPLWALAAGLAAADIAPRFGRRPLPAAALALLLPLVVFTDDPGLLRKGLQHAAIYRDDRFAADPWAAAPAFREPLLALPADAKVLMLNWNQGFYCPRPFLADSFFEASQIAVWLGDTPRTELPAKLGRRGVTHVLLERRWRVRYPPALLELLQGPGGLRPVWRSGDGEFVLFELAP